ncbi:hypothetical protein FB567DRAFT_543464 [Paraphoma chrysanthemicola]|uniref:Uncharacterized protein n=1 Tax=Paraphoma chrysanthemicola TaxID=798071 RepID=A0A8K0RJQ6_9PLEO|nr:hypothetical protein FB567DRAFT_543464 [Paraphoma chrysanthemicola]
MSSTLEKIVRFEVRCSCGERCENADAYLQHKKSCEAHRSGKNNELMTPVINDRMYTTTSAMSCPLGTSLSLIACWCGRTFLSKDTLQHHACYCGVHKHDTIVRSVPSRPAQIVEQGSSLDDVSLSMERMLLTPKATATMEAKGMVMQNTESRNSPSLAFTAPGSPFETDAGPLISPDPIASCICGYGFNTRERLGLHKRNLPLRAQRASKAQTPTKPGVHSLVTSFASLEISYAACQGSTARGKVFCMCGRSFVDQKARGKHARDAARHAWRPREEKEKSFKTPRPQYQVDEDLQEQVAMLAQQYWGTGGKDR